MSGTLSVKGAANKQTTDNTTDQPLRCTPVETLKKRRDFVRVRGGYRWSCGAFVIETRKQLATYPRETVGPRVGYTVTKRIGNAVIRNRIKRRFRAAVASLPNGELRDHHDYVLIARSGALKRTFADLKSDLVEGLTRIHRPKRNSRPGKSG